MSFMNQKSGIGRLPLCYLFLTGLFVGILIMNIGKSVLLKNTGLLNEYVLYDMKNMTVDSGALFWYVTGKRLKEVLVIAALATTSLGLVTVSGITVWYGIAAGMFVSAAVLRYGIKGILLTGASIFPQFLLYIPVMIFFLRLCEQICREIYQPVSSQKGKGILFRFLQIAGVILVVLTGCLLESYVNPVLLKRFLGIF